MDYTTSHKLYRPGLFLGLLVTVLLFQFVILPGNHSEKVHYPTPGDRPLIKDLTWGQVNFIQTTDTHGWYAGHLNQPQYHANWGHFISFVSHLRDIAHVNGQDLILVDTGDRHDGNGLSDATTPNGAKSLPIFVQQDYDLVTIGNHELYEEENSQQEYELVVNHFKEEYVCSNVEYLLDNGTYVPFGNKYRYFETKNAKTRVLALSFLFDFDKANKRARVTPLKQSIKQPWFTEGVASEFPEDKVDLLVVFGHIPVAHTWKELSYLHSKLREVYPKIKIQYFGGHSHIRDFLVFDENLTGLQSGRFCETVGWVSVNHTSTASETSKDVLGHAKSFFSRSYIDFNLDSFLHHSRQSSIEEFDTEKGLSISSSIKSIRKDLELNKVLGYVKKSNYYLDYAPLTSPKNIFKFFTDKVLPTLNSTNENSTILPNDNRIIIINTGSVRYDLYMGKYTVDSEYIVSPFRNEWVKLAIPKKYAVKIAPKLNEWDYITALKMDLTPHIRGSERGDANQEEVYEMEQEADSESQAVLSKRLSKGYITQDDFGTDGDDTRHRPVVNFPIPNVVLSVQIHDISDNELVDVVFYNFITSNIIWALKELDFTEDVTKEVEFYSDQYLGKLLNNYIQSYGA